MFWRCVEEPQASIDCLFIFLTILACVAFRRYCMLLPKLDHEIAQVLVLYGVPFSFPLEIVGDNLA